MRKLLCASISLCLVLAFGFSLHAASSSSSAAEPASPSADGTMPALAAIAGLFVDSLLGALPERRGWLNNDAVNFLSSLAAAVLAAWIGSRY